MRRSRSDLRDFHPVDPCGSVRSPRTARPRPSLPRRPPSRPPTKTRMGASPPRSGQLSSLGATNSGLRVLKHVGGSVPDILGCIKYVKSCRDAERRVRPEAGRQARRGHHGHRLDGRLRAQDRRSGHDQGGDRLSRQERQELRGSPDGDRRPRSRACAPRPIFRGGTSRSRACASPTAPGAGAGQGVRHRRGRRGVLRMGLKLDKRDAVISAHQGRPAPRRRLVQGRRAARPGGHLPRHAGTLHASREARHRSLARVRRPLPPVRRQLCEQAGRRRRPGRNLHRHDHDLLGAPAPGPSARRRDGRLHAARQRQGPDRLGRRHAALVGQGRHARRPLARAQSQRVPGDDPPLWRLRPLAQLPDDRRQGQ